MLSCTGSCLNPGCVCHIFETYSHSRCLAQFIVLTQARPCQLPPQYLGSFTCLLPRPSLLLTHYVAHCSRYGSSGSRRIYFRVMSSSTRMGRSRGCGALSRRWQDVQDKNTVVHANGICCFQGRQAGRQQVLIQCLWCSIRSMFDMPLSDPSSSLFLLSYV